MKNEYIKPEIELIEIKSEGVIAASSSETVNVNNEDEYTGRSYARKKFWKDMNQD